MFLAFFARVPRWAWGVAAAVAVVLSFLLWLRFHDRAVVREYEAEVQAEVTERASEAAVAATQAATRSITAVERRNEAARAVASEADDPLAAGLRELRK